MSILMKKKMTPEVRAKISKAKSGRKLTEQHKKRISLGGIGKHCRENGANWQGGKTPLRSTIRMTMKYKNWRKEIMERDAYTCLFCKQIGGKLHVDHIIPFATILEKIRSQNDGRLIFENAMKSKLLWQKGNGRTLCVACHKKTDSYLRNNFVRSY